MPVKFLQKNRVLKGKIHCPTSAKGTLNPSGESDQSSVHFRLFELAERKTIFELKILLKVKSLE